MTPKNNFSLSLQESDILLALTDQEIHSQRELASAADCSLGNVNKALKSLTGRGLAETQDNGAQSLILPTSKAKEYMKKSRPKRAIILAAGFGMRMVPINLETPKAFLIVHGERLIERIIHQLNDSGIYEIHVVVGFMKEKFDYLIDRYGVDLIVNPQYASRNSLSSLALASDYIDNSYIIPSDIWFASNPFRKEELYSWYMVSDQPDPESDVRVNRRRELVRPDDTDGNTMIGVSYLTGESASVVRKRVLAMSSDRKYDDDFWEDALYEQKKNQESLGKMIVPARVIPHENAAEINTYEQLRDLDEESEALHSEALDTIADVFGICTSEIHDIEVLKKGMTNRSFLFTVFSSSNPKADAGKYIMRIPGEGTDMLINRRQEADVYKAIRGKGLCDDPVYLNPDNGYKITKFLPGVRNCNPTDDNDLNRCIHLLKKFHEMKLQVSHTFDIFGQMDFYQSLWKGSSSMYVDYPTTYEHIQELKQYIESQPREMCLTHIDANADNFLFYREESDPDEHLQLTDWEYAGMQDPYVDIAMFCIYSMYDKRQCDHLIDLYFEGNCPEEIRTRIYCYIASCGLLWSNWCEYKAHLGVEFGEYSLRQYRFAKDFYKYAMERIK